MNRARLDSLSNVVALFWFQLAANAANCTKAEAVICDNTTGSSDSNCTIDKGTTNSALLIKMSDLALTLLQMAQQTRLFCIELEQQPALKSVRTI